MKITLISTDETPVAMGVKAISANLIRHGFTTNIVIMAGWQEDFRNLQWESLRDICAGSRLVGISCMTHGLKKAVEVRKNLQGHIKAPVIIGGIHPTIAPEGLLDEFDLVCIGEGEDLIVELARRIAAGEPFTDIPGLWGRNVNGGFKNPAKPLSLDLSDYPFPDYDLSHQFILESNRLVPMELPHIICDYFEVMGSRGCPHSCAFCSNQKLKENFPWRRKVRNYPTDYFIDHLKEICRVYPVVRSFWLEDDTFFAKDYAEIKSFAGRYKKEVNRPFVILVSPWTYSEEKVKLLLDAGMDRVIFGIQSGSENTNLNLYGRRIANQKIRDIAHSLNNFHGLAPYYDFIGMNPFETRDDLINTIRLVRQLPPPFFIFSNNLAFYPGTRLHELALKAGLDTSRRNRHTDPKHGHAILTHEKIRHKIFHFLFLMMGGRSNKLKCGLVLRIFISDNALKLYSLLDEKFTYLTDAAVSLASAVLMHADWKELLRKVLKRKHITALKKIYYKIFGQR